MAVEFHLDRDAGRKPAGLRPEQVHLGQIHEAAAVALGEGEVRCERGFGRDGAHPAAQGFLEYGFSRLAKSPVSVSGERPSADQIVYSFAVENKSG